MPRIGLLSDSHGRAETTRRGVDRLLEAGIDLLLHLGDVGAVEVIDALAVTGVDDARIQARLVFGNTDWDQGSLGRYAADLGIAVDHPAGRLHLPDGGQLVFCHGHEPAVMMAALREPVRYLCHGHTHRQTDQRQGVTRVVNPGALFRAQSYTVAILDTERDQVRFLPVEARGVA